MIPFKISTNKENLLECLCHDNIIYKRYLMESGYKKRH